MKEPITTERMDGMNKTPGEVWAEFCERLLHNMKANQIDYAQYMEWAKTQDWYKGDETNR